jgi:hypothetical protein
VVAAAVWGGGDHDGSGAGGRGGRGGPGGGPAVAGGPGWEPVAGAGVDGAGVAVPVRRAGGVLRQALMRVLPLADPASRSFVLAGSPAGDCLAVLEAVTAGLRRRFPALAAVTAHEVAGHLTGGLWLAPLAHLELSIDAQRAAHAVFPLHGLMPL